MEEWDKQGDCMTVVPHGYTVTSNKYVLLGFSVPLNHPTKFEPRNAKNGFAYATTKAQISCALHS